MKSAFQTRALFFSLQVADFLTTLGCTWLGWGERNPVTLRLIAWFGLYFGLLVAKAIPCVIVLRVRRLLWTANVAYVGVVAWNLFLITVFGTVKILGI